MQRRQQDPNHKLHEQHRTTKQMSIDNKQDEMRGLVDYNTERQRCAETIVAIMAKMKNKSSDEAEFKKKLWNHLAAMADYKLDIDYPYEIEKMSDRSSDRQRIAYPQPRLANATTVQSSRRWPRSSPRLRMPTSASNSLAWLPTR